MSNISSIIKSIQDIMRKDVGVDGDAQRIGQLVWMFFLKILDDQEEQLELTENNYTSPIPEPLRWRNWAADAEGITGDELSDFVNIKLFPTLKELSAEGKQSGRAVVVRNVFVDAYNYMKSGQLIRQVINKINEIDFNRSADKHTFGDIYEQILKDLQSAGNAGEFYTPRAVTQFMVDMANPQLGEMVLDPACGTGGFLSCTIKHLRQQTKTPKDWEALQKTINGVEKKSLPHLLCTTNMLLHGIEVPTNIKHDNMLSTPIKDHPWRKKVDLVLTNPPFGGTEEDGIENNFPSAYRTRETADLFLFLIVEMLKDKGRAAVVLPDGTLSGEGMKTRLKEKLLDECNLHTIVRLPNGVFNPYTSIKTNLLFFEKGTPTTEIWYYEHQYPKGYKSYSKTKPMRLEEFDTEKAWWNKREESDFAWRVSIETIKANDYNLDLKNPHRIDPSHREPKDLLGEYEAAIATLHQTQDILKDLLATALRHYDKGHELSDTNLILTQFRHLTQSEESVDRLRKLIIDLAVRGRFTKSSDIEWTSKTLGQIVTFEYGKGLPAKVRATNGVHPVYGSNGIVGHHAEALIYEPSIVVGRKGSAGALNIASQPFWPTDVTYYSTPPKYFDIRFYYYLLSTLGLDKLGKGIKPGLNRNEAYRISISYPPLAEQKRIVAKVDELMTLCDQLKAQITQTQTLNTHLMDSLIHHMTEAEDKSDIEKDAA